MSSSARVPVFSGSVTTARSLPEWGQTVTSHDIQQRSMLGQISEENASELQMLLSDMCQKQKIWSPDHWLYIKVEWKINSHLEALTLVSRPETSWAPSLNKDSGPTSIFGYLDGTGYEQFNPKRSLPIAPWPVSLNDRMQVLGTYVLALWETGGLMHLYLQPSVQTGYYNHNCT